MYGAGLQYLFHVVIEGIAAEQQASGGVSDDLRVRVFDGREHALGHGSPVKIEIRVDRADHYVELCKDFIGVIERSVLEDVHF